MLAFIGGLAFAAVTGRPDVAIPVVLAAELGYLGMLGTHPKFQKYVNAQEHKAVRAAQAESSDRAYWRMMKSLSKRSRKRFDDVRSRCSQLRRISDDLKQSDSDDIGGLEELQQSGLSRLLWIYLKLLFTEQSMRKFFEQTDIGVIENKLNAVRKRLEQEQAGKARERILETLQDNLSTSELRLANYQKARENHELVELELQRLENKIHSLCELGVNQRDPDFITGQVDGVAESMLKAHDTINELEFITGVRSEQNEDVPDLMQMRKQRVIH